MYRMNSSGYVGNVTVVIVECSLYCVLFSNRVSVRVRVRIGIRFSVWLASCYAHVSVLFQVVINTLPNGTDEVH